ncbi:hypothetical protein PBT90_11290 [Algoriphagus halophytocola]|uniref:Uncharacterized protein n=1 Tax=Algoriphagus halophytocola TaxID=2991499 RepID=A0ABY6MJL0_9BACT|nr:MULTISPECIES: hypothetical protein [unclassified Algoriphagus]UZD23967.1 hypothetical protein OM944_05600 [Algoriphagus sp. TR-M5]WBL41339.1 hypothetical protein PBT90_11290 [Algoriphagus sp. TR-M9]
MKTRIFKFSIPNALEGMEEPMAGLLREYIHLLAVPVITVQA